MTNAAWLDFRRESETKALAKFDHYKLISEKSKTAWARKLAREKEQNAETHIIGPNTTEDSAVGGGVEQ